MHGHPGRVHHASAMLSVRQPCSLEAAGTRWRRVIPVPWTGPGGDRCPDQTPGWRASCPTGSNTPHRAGADGSGHASGRSPWLQAPCRTVGHIPVRCLRLFGLSRLPLLAAGGTEVRAPVGKALAPKAARVLRPRMRGTRDGGRRNELSPVGAGAEVDSRRWRFPGRSCRIRPFDRPGPARRHARPGRRRRRSNPRPGNRYSGCGTMRM